MARLDKWDERNADMTTKLDLSAGKGAQKPAKPPAVVTIEGRASKKPNVTLHGLDWDTARIDIWIPCKPCDGTGRLDNPLWVKARYAQDQELQYTAAHLNQRYVPCPECQTGMLRLSVLLSELLKHAEASLKADKGAPETNG